LRTPRALKAEILEVDGSILVKEVSYLSGRGEVLDFGDDIVK
jgi:hypothetical protein